MHQLPLFYTLEEVRLHLRIGRCRIWQLVQDGRLHPVPSARDQRRSLYPINEVDALAAGKTPLQEVVND